MSAHAVVIGGSAGSSEVIARILERLPHDLDAAVVIVQHLGPGCGSGTVRFFSGRAGRAVQFAHDKEPILGGSVYMAPPDYHLMVEHDRTFALCGGERVNYSRPSIDVLFETAAQVYFDRLVGVLLTGANRDGSQGLRRIKEHGGYVLVQDPSTSLAPTMPRSGLDATDVDGVADAEQLASWIVSACCRVAPCTTPASTAEDCR